MTVVLLVTVIPAGIMETKSATNSQSLLILTATNTVYSSDDCMHERVEISIDRSPQQAKVVHGHEQQLMSA